MTALTYRNVATAGDGNGTNLLISAVTGVANGDHLWLVLYAETTAAASVTGTWTLVGTVNNGTAFQFTVWKRIAASEPANYTVSWVGSANVWRSGAGVAWSGGDATTQEDAAGTITSGASSTSATALSMTPVTGDAEVIYMEADFTGAAGGVTPPTGTTPTFTELTDFSNLEIASGPLATAAATGTKTGTIVAGASTWAAALVASRPAVAGGAAAKVPYTRDAQLVQWRGD